LADSYTSHSLIPGYKEIPFNPTNNMAVQEESISSWYLSKQIQPGAYALNEYDYINPKADLKVNSSISQGTMNVNMKFTIIRVNMLIAMKDTLCKNSY